ncbi:uncharacterized protein SEPMUDRAFT_112801 [Sphaerulina musiva SO2202]|uniref:Uncharacterized protein n=1 Tax=Sphaerulina musiva (strain SO2202) TaxID=692275 RepID=N1QLT4_SPHMS|nr:uncharacterized protein SEPMUDRAFT_112801 [Sphaerulina musiva SO2202]EMF16773.1 hypothetical protein SEPMUDRAFT_112801 [Sphaerulina musiva SO2202]
MQFSQFLTILGLVVLAASTPIKPLGDDKVKRGPYWTLGFDRYDNPPLADEPNLE